jgi:hypothetical protein
MNKEQGLSVEQIDELTGLGKKNIENMISAYEAMKPSLDGKEAGICLPG